MDIDESRLQEFMGSFLNDMGGAMTMLMVSLGDELGFYDAMATSGPVDAAGLAEASGCTARLAQEWLDQQASAGYVGYDAEAGSYELPAEHAMALAHRQSPVFVAGGTISMVAMFKDFERIAAAFRSGRGRGSR